ncbi:MAG: carboxypeptidase-like regulatory domain-containing protein [Bacteroidota bacterium]
MKILFTLLCCITIIASTFAQAEIYGQIIDRKTKAPLPYANIGIKNSTTGTVSDDHGRFNLKHYNPEDSLLISYIGYQTIMISANAIQPGSTVPLEPESFYIEEVKITASRFKNETILGVRNDNGRGPSVGYGNPQLGTELGTVIRIDKETFLKSVNVVLNHAKGDSLLFRINFYDFSNNVIGDKVVRENIYLKEKQRKGTYTINLESNDITLSKDVLVTVEWLKNFGDTDSSQITFDTKKSKKDSGVYIRSSQTSDFRKMEGPKKYKPCIYLIGMQ